MSTIEYHKCCPVCGESKFQSLNHFSATHLVKCDRCKLVFAERIPSTNELLDHYSHYNRGRHISDLTIKKYEKLLTEFSAFKHTSRLIDVGCGSGFFLDVAGKMGWNVFGTEYGEETVNFCKNKGLTVFEGPIEQIHLEPSSFDIITSFEVVEHLIYPRTHFQKLFELLRPGGMLYITTPNFDAITRYLLKEDWNIITYPEHLTYFSASTLDKSLRDVGFLRKEMIADGISVDRLRNSFSKKGVVSENETPSNNKKKVLITNESIRKASENNPAFKLLRKTIDWGLNTTRKGEFLKGYYIKPL